MAAFSLLLLVLGAERAQEIANEAAANMGGTEASSGAYFFNDGPVVHRGQQLANGNFFRAWKKLFFGFQWFRFCSTAASFWSLRICLPVCCSCTALSRALRVLCSPGFTSCLSPSLFAPRFYSYLFFFHTAGKDSNTCRPFKKIISGANWKSRSWASSSWSSSSTPGWLSAVITGNWWASPLVAWLTIF